MSLTLLLGGASLILLLAAAIGYAWPLLRRGRPSQEALAEQPGEPGFTWSARTAMPSFAQAEGERALGYTTFPERKRVVSPEGRYQARRISAACEARGMVLHKLVGDVRVLLRPGPPSGPVSTTRSTCSRGRGELSGRGRARPPQHVRGQPRHRDRVARARSVRGSW